MKKEWYFDRFCGEQIVAYAEDGKIVECRVENEESGDIVGNIYKGRVANVVAGMQAAFVSCGMERNCYLPLDEGASRFATYDGSGSVTERLELKEGDELLVQVVKPPRGSKGAKVTCALSLVGKNLIFLPATDFLGISRKIEDTAVRERLLKEADKLRDQGSGFIVRTAAEEANKRQLKTESEYLKRIYRAMLEKAKSSPVGTAVYKEFDLPLRVMRDSLGEATKLYVGDRELYERVRNLALMRSDLGEKQVVFYGGPRNMFAHFGLSDQIYALTRPRVELQSGAYLIIDRTEAMTVIDVNTGKYTGESDLESTVFETNLLAAREIARQVRLRNIGGIVAVDFIDMAEEAHRTRVDEELMSALSRDKAKCRVLPMGDLCVTMFTRKRTYREISSFLLQPCPHCTREGYILSDVYMAMRIRSEIRELFADGYSSVIIELNRTLMEKILSEHYFSLEIQTSWRDKRVYMIPHRTYHEEQFTARGDNSRVLTLPDDAQILY